MQRHREWPHTKAGNIASNTGTPPRITVPLQLSVGQDRAISTPITAASWSCSPAGQVRQVVRTQTINRLHACSPSSDWRPGGR
jgi:hypothetical protein